LTYELLDHLKIDVDNITITEESKTSDLNDKRAIKLPLSIRLAQDYDHDQNEFKFQNAYFTCNVCFSDKTGKDCFKFDKCDHVFCIECMKGYFETLISDGNVKSLTCPQDKCESQAHPTQVIIL
jgi:E3 ubiquitin-protein ligase RNF14